VGEATLAEMGGKEENAPKAAIDLLLGKRLGFTQFQPFSVLARTVLEGVESRRLVCASMIMAGWPFKIFL
jgi:hypothetical protein